MTSMLKLLILSLCLHLILENRLSLLYQQDARKVNVMKRVSEGMNDSGSEDGS